MKFPDQFVKVAVLCTGLDLLAVTICACTGEVGARSPGGSADGYRDDSPDKNEQPTPPNTTHVSAGPMPLRRLTRLELNNTLADLLGDQSRPASQLPADVRGESGFLNGNAVSTVDAERIGDMAEAVALGSTAKLMAATGCTSGKSADGCASAFITSFGARAFRRPLEPAEVSEFKRFEIKLRTEIGLDQSAALSFVLRAFLQSPNFLYHFTVPPEGSSLDGDVLRLRGYDLASRLSYFLWQSMPDDVLFLAAKDNRLETAADANREARRMLQDPRAKATVMDFHHQWLNLAAVSNLQKGSDFPLTTGAAATAELDAFIDHVVFGEGRGSLAALLTSTVSFASAPLAKLYGMPNAPDGQQVNLDSSQRSGILTRVGFLALNGKGQESDPIHRGITVLERLLCEQTPPPMPGIPPLGPPSPTLSTRQRNLEHQNNPSCSGCHSRFEPLGFAFEYYDGLGRYRSTDGGKAVDASAKVETADGAESFDFKNAVELSQSLARSAQVQRCVANNVFRFAVGRLESEADTQAVNDILGAYKKSSLDVRELIVAIASSSSFLLRAPVEGEVLQ